MKPLKLKRKTSKTSTTKIDDKEFYESRKKIQVSPAETVKILRELQNMSQVQLSIKSGIPQGTISAIERGTINIGIERAKTLARALKCHPAVIVFSDWCESETKRNVA